MTKHIINLNGNPLKKLYETFAIIANNSKVTPAMLIPSPLLAPRILSICGILTSIEPAIIARPNALLRAAFKHSTEKNKKIS